MDGIASIKTSLVRCMRDFMSYSLDFTPFNYYIYLIFSMVCVNKAYVTRFGLYIYVYIRIYINFYGMCFNKVHVKGAGVCSRTSVAME